MRFASSVTGRKANSSVGINLLRVLSRRPAFFRRAYFRADSFRARPAVSDIARDRRRSRARTRASDRAAAAPDCKACEGLPSARPRSGCRICLEWFVRALRRLRGSRGEAWALTLVADWQRLWH